MSWKTEEAIDLCRKIESISPDHGAHVALTGGLLYKDGPRKDCDLLFYCIRQLDEIDKSSLLKSLESLGLVIGKTFGWVTKAKYKGKDIDMFFPDGNPPSSKKPRKGAY